MEIEEKVGDPELAAVGEAEEAPESEATPAPETAPEQAPATPPSKYAGKSPDELSRMLEEQERYLGRLGNELGDTRQQAEYWRREAEVQRQERAAREAAAQQQPQPGSGWDWDRFQQQPDVTIESVVDRRLQQAELVREEREFNREFQRGKAQAMRERPELFEGISDKVEALIVNGRRGGFVNSSSVGDPETWYYAAGLLKMRESNFNFSKGPNPVSPTQTERPMARKQAPGEVKERVEFDDKSSAMVKGLGFSEARAAEILRGEPRKPK